MRRLCSHDHPPGTLILVVVLLVAGGAEAKAVQTYAATAGSTVSGRVAGIPKTAQYLKSVLPPTTAAALNTLEGVANKHQFHSARVAGSSFEYPEESLMLLNASRARPGEALNTICEIGFNAGLSAELLLAHNNASLHEFDILENPWSRAVMATFHALHPGRLTMHAGDTSCTVRRALRGGRGKPDILCDRFFVDGDHSEPQVTNDFYAAIRFTRPGGLVLIDDVRARARSVPLAACLAIALFQTRY
jgi:predicted O-methyltransferase YrrM